MNKLNAGIAPIVVILIVLGLVVVGGGVYVATKSKTSVVVESVSPSASPAGTTLQPTASKTITSTATPATKTSTATPSKTVAPSSTFATFQAAFDSKQSLNCVGPWIQEKGPAGRSHYFMSNGKLRIQSEENVNGTARVSYIDIYQPGVAVYQVFESEQSVRVNAVGSIAYNNIATRLSRSMTGFQCTSSVDQSVFVVPDYKRIP